LIAHLTSITWVGDACLIVIGMYGAKRTRQNVLGTGQLSANLATTGMLFSDSMDASAGFVIYSQIRHFREIRRGVRKMEREVHAKEEASREEEV